MIPGWNMYEKQEGIAYSQLMMCKLRRRHFNKLEAAHAINHIKDATNITLHILKVSRHIDLCGIQKNSFM